MKYKHKFVGEWKEGLDKQIEKEMDKLSMLDKKHVDARTLKNIAIFRDFMSDDWLQGECKVRTVMLNGKRRIMLSWDFGTIIRCIIITATGAKFVEVARGTSFDFDKNERKAK